MLSGPISDLRFQTFEDRNFSGIESLTVDAEGLPCFAWVRTDGTPSVIPLRASLPLNGSGQLCFFSIDPPRI